MRFRIVPTSREFFDDFSLAAKNLVECVERFKDVLADTSDAARRHSAVKEVERAGDDHTSRILTRLDSTPTSPTSYRSILIGSGRAWMTDRRAYFFLGGGLLVLVIQPIIPQYRWATLSVAVIYLAFAVLFATASISAKRAAKRNGHL